MGSVILVSELFENTGFMKFPSCTCQSLKINGMVLCARKSFVASALSIKYIKGAFSLSYRHGMIVGMFYQL